MDTGESPNTLVKLSHIHLFGTGLVVLAIGLAWVLQILISLYQLWFLTAPQGHFQQ